MWRVSYFSSGYNFIRLWNPVLPCRSLWRFSYHCFSKHWVCFIYQDSKLLSLYNYWQSLIFITFVFGIDEKKYNYMYKESSVGATSCGHTSKHTYHFQNELLYNMPVLHTVFSLVLLHQIFIASDLTLLGIVMTLPYLIYQ